MSMFCNGSWHLATPIQSIVHSPRHAAYVCKHAAHRLVLLKGTFAGKGDGAVPDGHQLVLSGGTWLGEGALGVCARGTAPHGPTCCFRWLLLSRYVIKVVAAIGHSLVQSGERGSGQVSWGSVVLWGSAPHAPTCCFRWLLLSRYVIKLVAAIGHQLVPNGSHSLLKLGPQTVSVLVVSLSPTSLGRGPYTRGVVRRQKPLLPHVTKNFALTIFCHIPSGARILPFPACHSCH